jgi:hypothetical protein
MPYLPNDVVDKMLQAPELKAGRGLKGEVPHKANQGGYMSQLVLLNNKDGSIEKKNVKKLVN